MPPTRKRAGDLTGLRTENLQKEHAEELTQRRRELTTIQAANDADRLQPVDLSGPTSETLEGVEVKRPKRRVRALADVDATIGIGNDYHLEEGRTYDLPAHVADHLTEKGLVWA
jgi:hypothetical protein